MKSIITFMIICICIFHGYGQENKFEYIPKVKKRVEVVNILGNLSINGINGNSIEIITKYNNSVPERAKGLEKMVAVEDNTGIGINIVEENGTVYITGIDKKIFDCEINIPYGIMVHADYDNPFIIMSNGKISVSSFKDNIEIKTINSNIKLINCTGPFAISSISGDIDLMTNSLFHEYTNSFATFSGRVDLSIPESVNLTFEVETTSGDIYNNLNLKLVQKAKVKTYTMNGGGQSFHIKTISGNIYLRRF